MVEVKSMSTKVSTPISVLRIPQKLERAPFAGSKKTPIHYSWNVRGENPGVTKSRVHRFRAAGL